MQMRKSLAAAKNISVCSISNRFFCVISLLAFSFSLQPILVLRVRMNFRLIFGVVIEIPFFRMIFFLRGTHSKLTTIMAKCGNLSIGNAQKCTHIVSSVRTRINIIRRPFIHLSDFRLTLAQMREMVKTIMVLICII